MEKTFKCDSPKTHALKIASGIVMGVGVIPILFMGLGALKGDNNDLTDWAETWWPIGAVLLSGGAAWAIYLTWWYYSVLTVNVHPSLGVQLLMRDPDGDESAASGSWDWYAYYVKEYARYGMYKRHKHLVLFHKDRAWIAFTKDCGVIDDPAAPYTFMNGELSVNVPIYHTKEIDGILSEISGSPGATQIIPGQKKSEHEPSTL